MKLNQLIGVLPGNLISKFSEFNLLADRKNHPPILTMLLVYALGLSFLAALLGPNYWAHSAWFADWTVVVFAVGLASSAIAGAGLVASRTSSKQPNAAIAFLVWTAFVSAVVLIVTGALWLVACLALAASFGMAAIATIGIDLWETVLLHPCPVAVLAVTALALLLIKQTRNRQQP